MHYRDTLIKDLELIEVDPRSFLALRKDGKVSSQRILGANQSAGIRSAVNIYPGGTTANSITIAAFYAQFDFGKIPYNGGVISGLPPSTKYHVFCDDLEMAGGAVLWKATTDIQVACEKAESFYLYHPECSRNRRRGRKRFRWQS